MRRGAPCDGGRRWSDSVARGTQRQGRATASSTRPGAPKRIPASTANQTPIAAIAEREIASPGGRSGSIGSVLRQRRLRQRGLCTFRCSARSPAVRQQARTGHRSRPAATVPAAKLRAMAIPSRGQRPCQRVQARARLWRTRPGLRVAPDRRDAAAGLLQRPAARADRRRAAGLADGRRHQHQTIGYFALVGLPYTFKFVWAPLLDRFEPRWLGRRRGWIVVFQLAHRRRLPAMARFDPQSRSTPMAMLAVADRLSLRVAGRRLRCLSCRPARRRGARCRCRGLGARLSARDAGLRRRHADHRRPVAGLARRPIG